MIFWTTLAIGGTLFVAYANGANDNFKGVATLFGSGTTDYRKALWWATATTLAGSIAAFFVATELIAVFQGRGLVPDALAESPQFLGAVTLGAALTVFVATKIGLPISTTHSLTGALFGSGFMALGFDLGFEKLTQGVFLPLLFSPLVAVVLAALAYPVLITALRFAGFSKESCVCIGNEIVPVTVSPEGYVVSRGAESLRIVVDRETECVQRLSGHLIGINAQSLVDFGHFLSAGAVGFARGLNDTPKIVALGLVATVLNLSWLTALVALVMALGGLLSAGKVADTVSKRITAMDPEQGFVTNLVTSFLVIFASKWGLPVSTTHVSCGALFGIGIANGHAQWGIIRTILLAWLLTLPFAGISAGVIYMALFRLRA